METRSDNIREKLKQLAQEDLKLNEVRQYNITYCWIKRSKVIKIILLLRYC